MMEAHILVKPRLRGVSHEVAFYVSLLAVGVLASAAPTAQARTVSLVYGACLAFLFGASALYHRPTWSPRARARMRRVDHAAIYLLIAGTFTPFALALPPASAKQMLLIAWIGAGLGVLQSLFWVHAPKPLAAGLYVLLGWSVVPFLREIHAVAGTWSLALLAAGGVVYTAGAVVYALRKPNPVPGWFGYHEIFHALVIVAASMHFSTVASLVLRA